MFSRPTDDALSVLLVCLPLVTFQLGMCAFCDQGELHQKLRFFYPRIPAAANRADFCRILILPENKKTALPPEAEPFVEGVYFCFSRSGLSLERIIFVFLLKELRMVSSQRVKE